MKMKMFAFRPILRPHVRAIGDLLAYANSNEGGGWANQSSSHEVCGVYGYASYTLEAIIREEFRSCLRYLGKSFPSDCMGRLAEIAGSFSIDEIEEAINETLIQRHEAAATADSAC